MASASSTAPGANKEATKIVAHGVAPLRAGQGSSFVLRRLHSLSGIVPVGAFLFEHILISNSTAIPQWARRLCPPSQLSGQSLRWCFFLELFGIWLPILFHALYGFYIWFRGDGNTVAYPWSGNWMYTAQPGRGESPSSTSCGTRTRCGLPELICTRIRWHRLARSRWKSCTQGCSCSM